MTASHLPYTRNGLKFFTKKGGLTSVEVEEICEKAARKYANRQAKVSTKLPRIPTIVDFMSTYAKHLRDIIKQRVNHPLHYETPLKGFQVSFLSLTLSSLTYVLSAYIYIYMHLLTHTCVYIYTQDMICAFVSTDFAPYLSYRTVESGRLEFLCLFCLFF